MNSAFLLIGSNLGNRIENLEKARLAISKASGKIMRESAIYETAAWGNINQQPFLNQALEIKTDLLPGKLLDMLKGIEKEMGRKNEVKWGPRIIDIDILLMDTIVLKTEKLTLPHPEMQNRNFTLVPLAEIAPDAVHPVLQQTIYQLLKNCKDTLEVVKLPSLHEA